MDEETKVFVGRRDEALRVARAYGAHLESIRAGIGGGDPRRNVVNIHAAGGIGKSALTQQLCGWLTDASEWPPAWGALSSVPGVGHTAHAHAVCRWVPPEMGQEVDGIDILHRLRQGAGRFKREGPAFDLVFTVLHQQLRPQQTLTLTQPRGRVVSQTTADVIASVIDMGLGGFGSATLTLAAAVRELVSTRRLLSKHQGLHEIIGRCEAAEPDLESSLTVLVGLARLLTAEIEQMAPDRRPRLVVALDHYERITGTSRRTSERLINALAHALPYHFFVISGRDRLTWPNEMGTALRHVGPRVWPDLAGPVAPSNIALGFLTDEDAVQMLQGRLDELGLAVVEGVPAALVREYGGWPQHLAMMAVIGSTRYSGAPLEQDDLDRPLPELVDRLMEDLPPEQARALKAASLFPAFETDVVAAAAGVDVAVVERLCKRSICLPNPDGPERFRLHDTVRSVIREAGADAAAGWSPSDWTRAAQRAIVHLHARFAAAVQGAEDSQALALGASMLNVAVESGIADDCLIEVVREAPSITLLHPLVRTRPRGHIPPRIRTILDMINALSMPVGEERIALLAAHRFSDTREGHSAALWLAYDMRRLGRIDEALEVLRYLHASSDRRKELLVRQQAITLVQGRRFTEATTFLRELDAVDAARVSSMIEFAHGRPEARVDLSATIHKTRSRRAVLQQEGLQLLARFLHGQATPEAITIHLQRATEFGEHEERARALFMLGAGRLLDNAYSTRRIAELKEITEAQPNLGFHAYSTLLALRGWACGEESLIAAAHLYSARYFRPSYWTGLDVLLAHLNYPLPEMSAQWLEPQELVAARWLQVWHGVVERAHQL